MKIIPIATTNVHWALFVTKCNSILGKSPTRHLDSNGVPVGTPLSYLSALDSFSNEHCNPFKPNENTLNHVSISFMMIMEACEFHDLLEKAFNRIHIIKYDKFNSPKETIIFTSATLKEWKDTLINYKGNQEWTLQMWSLMDQLGLISLFSDYKINSQKQIEKR